jgi:hypothetical protein
MAISAYCAGCITMGGDNGLKGTITSTDKPA